MKKIAILLFILTLTSCATILNSKTAKVKISADKQSKIIFNNDTIPINKTQTTIRPQRSSDDLKLIILKDSLKKEFYFRRKLSSVFWLNTYFYGVGAIVDLTNNKRFRYKKNIHFITDTTTNTIALSEKKITFIPKNKIFIYTNPLKFLDFFSIPMATVGVEYFAAKNFSLSAEYGTKVSGVRLNNEDEHTLKNRGEMYRLETKLYNTYNLTKNVHLNEYIGLEVLQKRSQFNDHISFYEKSNLDTENDLVRITDNFGTKKRVTIINLKYGLLVPINDDFYFDFYTGLGVRIKKFKDVNKEFDPSIHQTENRDDGLFSLDFLTGSNGSEFNFNLGFKFGYKF